MNIQKIIGYKAYGNLRKAYRSLIRSNVYNVKKKDLVDWEPINQKVRTKGEYEAILSGKDYSTVLNKRGIKNSSKKEYAGLILPGKCDFCGCTAGFSVPKELNNMISYRETAGCTGCRQLARVRVILSKCRELCREYGHKDVYMYETGEVKNLVGSFVRGNVVGSEYISEDAKSGDIINGILHEDGHNLSFDDESFDVVISRDVFEHVNDFRLCLKEMCRVTRQGGHALITIPWFVDKDNTVQRAKIEDGKLLHILEPAYHWNPVSGKRDSLVFWDYGWDFLDELKKAGFSDAYVQTYFDVKKGYIGEVGTYFVGVK